MEFMINTWAFVGILVCFSALIGVILGLNAGLKLWKNKFIEIKKQLMKEKEISEARKQICENQEKMLVAKDELLLNYKDMERICNDIRNKNKTLENIIADKNAFILFMKDAGIFTDDFRKRFEVYKNK